MVRKDEYVKVGGEGEGSCRQAEEDLAEHSVRQHGSAES